MGANQSQGAEYDIKILNLIFVNLLDKLDKFVFQPGTPDYDFWKNNIKKTEDAYSAVKHGDYNENKLILSDFVPWLRKILNDKNYFKHLCNEYLEYSQSANRIFNDIETEIKLSNRHIEYQEMYIKQMKKHAENKYNGKY